LISVIKEIKVLPFTHLRVVPFRKKREMARSAAHTTPLKKMETRLCDVLSTDACRGS
jgi:hypothetical protein